MIDLNSGRKKVMGGEFAINPDMFHMNSRYKEYQMSSGDYFKFAYSSGRAALYFVLQAIEKVMPQNLEGGGWHSLTIFANL